MKTSKKVTRLIESVEELYDSKLNWEVSIPVVDFDFDEDTPYWNFKCDLAFTEIIENLENLNAVKFDIKLWSSLMEIIPAAYYPELFG